MHTKFLGLYNSVQNLLLKKEKSALQEVCNLLENEVEHYHWVGFYFMNNAKQVLEIGPYAGEKTEHNEIAFGTGICGQVAKSGKTFVVPDVSLEENYLSCSVQTKAEIVEPIYKNEMLIGQLDIDSHHANPFTKDDEEFLKAICALVAKYI